jgi:hypothetical protein
MPHKDPATLSDQELLDEARSLQSFSLTSALLIGFLAGIVLYSIFKSTFGLLMLIPLYMIHRFANDPRAKRAEAVDRQINTRNRKP